MRTNLAQSIAGYTVVEQLGETHYSTVYRASKNGARDTVIIKVFGITDPSAAEIARFRHEYALVNAIHIDGIVKHLDFMDFEGKPALVLEDFGGVSLKEILRNGFTVERFLDLAIRMAEILGTLHQGHIAHRDIKPSNILLNPTSDVLKITDFGISELMQRHEVISNPAIIEGTLAYISPEQTGRMNRGVDYRTDLYSLGVTFYEMLTGRVPFRSKDPMELIHAHIAKLPEPPDRHQPDVPTPVSDIVMKLLSKSATERYQSGFGLAADLRACLQQLRVNKSIMPFVLGSQDVSPRFLIPQRLVGRDAALETLQAAYDRVSHGAVEAILVTGEPGIGKSAVVHEMHKPVVAGRGYFIAGKFDPYQRAVPYSAIMQAFQSLLRQLLAENDARLAQWRQRLLSALGQNARIIAEAIPEIERIIGKQPEVPELGPEEARNRFNLVFKNFVRLFAAQSHPLVLFLDDLQWADSASLNLIETIATDSDLHCMLFVGAYRDNEVAAHHPLMLTRKAVQTAGVPTHTIGLGALTAEDIQGLIAPATRCAPGDALALALAVHAKTKGSPFFIHQFLKTIYDKRLLHLDPKRGWTWELREIQELQATDNVVRFMADKLHRLPEEALDIIQACACIGNDFDLETVSHVAQRSEDEVLAIIDELMREGLIQRVGESYRFCHNHIQEATYALLATTTRERIHYRIGQLDLGRTPPDQLASRIFYICDQLNQAAACIPDPAERTRLAALNLKAGIKAKESGAYAEAAGYLVMGGTLLAENAWRTDYDLAYALFSEQMTCQYLARNFDAAEDLFEVIIAHAANRVDQAKAYITMIVLYTNMRSPRDAIALGYKALSLFGIRISPDVGVVSVLLELIQVKWRLRKIGVEASFKLPLIEDKELNACLQLILMLGTPAYYFSPNLFAKLVLKGFNMALKHGRAPHNASGGGYIALATILQAALGDYALGYRLGEMALAFSERPENRNTAGMVHHIFAFFIQHWKRHARHNLEIFRKGHLLAMDAGDFIFAGHAVNAAADCGLMIGRRLDEILEENNRFKELMRIVKDPFITARHQENNQLIFNLKGQTQSRLSLSGPGYDEAAHLARLRSEKNFFGLCYTLLYKSKIHYLYGKFEEARQAAAELDKYIEVQVGTQLTAEHYFYYSLILLAIGLEGKRPNLKAAYLIRRNLRKLRRWGALCPENFQHKYDLVVAESMALKGRHQEALRHYRAAVHGAQSNGYLHEEALACERLARFYLNGGGQDEAKSFIRRADRCYAAWGATAKQEELRERYPDLLHVEGKPLPADDTAATTSSRFTSRSLDFSTVAQVSHVISSEIMLDRLLQKIMHMSIANAGAQRGYLILEYEGQLRVQASEEVDTGERQVLQALPLDACDGLSVAIVHYVYHGGEHLILGNALLEGAFTHDPHVLGQHCKSILCMPILNQGKPMGVLYMENNLTTEAFTSERLELLRLISAQAAVSIQNAKLYEDVTKEVRVREQTEAAMRVSEEKYRKILEELQDAYCEVDLKGTITFVNPAACAMVGCSHAALIGSNVRALISSAESIRLQSYFQTIYGTGKAGKPVSCALQGQNGGEIHLEIVASPIRDKTGHVIGFSNVGRDVSERERLELDLLESNKNVQSARAATILGLAKLAEYRDEDTGTHLERIREYARIIAAELAKKPNYKGYITPEYIEDIYNSAILHDIGKVGVPDAILRKPGKLTREEFEIIKTHSSLGGDALRDVEATIKGQTFLTLSKEIAYFHHEKWDGSGYPKGLKAEQIPLSARIVALADVYDALTSKRTYKEAFSHERAMEIIVNDRGTHFAPDVVDAFLVHAQEFRRIRATLLGEGVKP